MRNFWGSIFEKSYDEFTIVKLSYDEFTIVNSS